MWGFDFEDEKMKKSAEKFNQSFVHAIIVPLNLLVRNMNIDLTWEIQSRTISVGLKVHL